MPQYNDPYTDQHGNVHPLNHELDHLKVDLGHTWKYTNLAYLKSLLNYNIFKSVFEAIERFLSHRVKKRKRPRKYLGHIANVCLAHVPDCYIVQKHPLHRRSYKRASLFLIDFDCLGVTFMSTSNANVQADKPMRDGKVESGWSGVATDLRRKRFNLFKSLVGSLSRPLNILDIGGTIKFWEQVGFTNEDFKITVLNIRSYEVPYPNFTSVVGDARNMKEFHDKEFDIVYSNSVIEHVGTFEQQRQMANEVQRVGKRYFLQTPNRYFPIEPHFVFPFFQFLPLKARTSIAAHWRNGWGWKMKNREKGTRYVSSVRLLTKKELKRLFPGATIYKEKYLGLTKSFIVYNGW